MRGIVKKQMLLLLAIACCVLLGACSKKKDMNLSLYLNNTLEYFMKDTGVELALDSEGNYRNEELGIQVVIKDNVIQSIQLDATKSIYEIEKVRPGYKKKKVDRRIRDEYTSEPTITPDEELQEMSYAYQRANRQLTIRYNDKFVVQNVRIEITPYTVGGAVTGTTTGGPIRKDEIMVTVGNIDVSYSEAMIYLRAAQQIYESQFGNELWSYDANGNGTTIGALLKQKVLEQIIQLEVMNMVANDMGIALNDDEMLEVRNSATEFMNYISEQDRLTYGITEELAVRVFASNYIAEKLYETVTIDVDTEVSNEEAQQCRIQKIFIKTYGMDSQGNRTQLRDVELEEIKQKVDSLHAQALETTNFYALAESNSDDNTIEYVVGRGDLDEVEEKVAFSLKDGEVSKIIEKEDGYVILYCVDAYDEDATLQVKEEIIEQRRSDLFVDLYSQWYIQYDVKVHMNLWNQLELSPIDDIK